MDEAETRAITSGLEDELRALGTAEWARREREYLKSDLLFLGVPVPQIRGVARRFWRARGSFDRTGLLTLTAALWEEPIHERRMLAVELLTHYEGFLKPEDLTPLEQFVREARTWALVDTLAIRVVGGIVDRHPGAADRLDRWALDPDFWVRRTALLALIGPLREGRGDFERFSGYADGMVEEREFFIRKAIGWVLRETSHKRPEMVAQWVRPRVTRLSGVTMREAVRHLPEDVRDRLVQAHRERRSSGVPARPRPPRTGGSAAGPA